MNFLSAIKSLKDKITSTVKFYSDKRYSTIAGTLVYFLLMSIAPFILWLTIVFGGKIDAEQLLSYEFFNSISPILRYMKRSAEEAASGAGVLFLVTSLYSSTNFFYHLRRSGEIVYGAKKVKGGIKLRLASLLFIVVTIMSVALTVGISVIGTAFLSGFLPELVSQILSLFFITALAFAISLSLNFFACPYKLKLSEVLPGSLLTLAMWIVFMFGFGIYTTFATPERLYGRIASLIIFLLWCYVMMSCFVIGMIKNGSYKTERRAKIF